MVDLSQITTRDFEKCMKEYLMEANERLDNEFAGTREAIKMLAKEKTQEYMMFIDKGFDKKELELLSAVITVCMHQTFSYGYGIGKFEGTSNRKICL